MCLVFFLGGVPMGSNSIATPHDGFGPAWMGNSSGFINSTTNPFGYNATSKTTRAPVDGNEAKGGGAFFDFKRDRLDALNHYHDVYWNQEDVGKNVYYYFSAKEGNDYLWFGANPPSGAGYNAFSSGRINVTGGYGTYDANPANNTHMSPLKGVDGKYLNPNSFQIVSAGRDGAAGLGWDPVNNGGAVWPGIYTKGKPGGGDDLSNFAQYLLGGDE
jgi:hypothetical protein